MSRSTQNTSGATLSNQAVQKHYDLLYDTVRSNGAARPSRLQTGLFYKKAGGKTCVSITYLCNFSYVLRIYVISVIKKHEKI